MNETGLRSTKEAADELGVSVRTIHRWVDAGKLPVARKLPGRTGSRLFESGVIEMMRRQLAKEKA